MKVKRIVTLATWIGQGITAADVKIGGYTGWSTEIFVLDNSWTEMEIVETKKEPDFTKWALPENERNLIRYVRVEYKAEDGYRLAVHFRSESEILGGAAPEIPIMCSIGMPEKYRQMHKYFECLCDSMNRKEREASGVADIQLPLPEDAALSMTAVIPDVAAMRAAVVSEEIECIAYERYLEMGKDDALEYAMEAHGGWLLHRLKNAAMKYGIAGLTIK